MTSEPDARPPVGDRAAARPPEPVPATRDDDLLDAVALGAVDVEVVAETDSTNTLLAARARAGGPGAEAVVAEHQTRGRGRLDRTWEAPAGAALTFSVLLRPRVAPERWPWLPLLAGHVVASVLRAHGYPAGLKWPNDVLLAEAGGTTPSRKVAGLLAERVETPTGLAAVVGIGLNVHLAAADLPVPTATSLALADPGRRPPARTALLRDLVLGLRAAHERWQSDPTALRADYSAACTTIGQPVRVDLPGGGALRGTAVGVDAQGRLEVRPDGPQGTGPVVAVAAGDVVHVRPAAEPPAQVR